METVSWKTEKLRFLGETLPVRSMSEWIPAVRRVAGVRRGRFAG